ncbi:MAG: hypothetical protein MK085_09060, partial [Phycisphaerales bacterium]|nr:hypothetical protein [Phycisphaerales bacterium]
MIRFVPCLACVVFAGTACAVEPLNTPRSLLGLEPPAPAQEESMVETGSPPDGAPQGRPGRPGRNPGDPPQFVERIPDRTYFATGYIHEFSSSFSNSGSVSVNRGFGSAGIRLGASLDTPLEVSLGMAWSGDWYSFSNDNPLSPVAGVKPWSNIQAIAILSRMEIELTRNWRLFGGVSMVFAGAPSVDIGDAFTAGGSIGAAYAFDRTLRLGGGVLLSSQLEESILVIPLVIVYWEMTDDLVLSNVIGPETYPTGAGIELAWRPDDTS